MKKYRWIPMPPVKEGYEIVRVKEVDDLLGGPVGDKDLLMTLDRIIETTTPTKDYIVMDTFFGENAVVHMGGRILVKEKETEFGRGPEEAEE